MNMPDEMYYDRCLLQRDGEPLPGVARCSAIRPVWVWQEVTCRGEGAADGSAAGGEDEWVKKLVDLMLSC